MGIIEKQATRSSIFSYLGAALGFLTVLWLPYVLTTDENGLIRILISVVALLAQFGNLGFPSVTIRFFPYFRNKEKGHHGFLYYAVLVSLVGFLLCWLVFLLLKQEIIESNMEKSRLFVEYIYYLMPLTLFTIFFNLFDSYLRATFNSVAGPLSKDLIQRILILLSIGLYYLRLCSFDWFLFLYISSTCLPTIILMMTIIRAGEWHVRPIRGFLPAAVKSDIYKLSLFAILSGGAGAIILNIDAIMINQMLGLKKTGAYGIAMQFGTLMLIPARALYRIMSTIIAEHFKNQDIPAIAALYRQSCNSQLAIGLLLYVGLITNIDNVMMLLPPEYESGKYVIVILATGYLIEMATGINQVIIATSPYYRYDAYFVLLMVVLIIVANYLLIPVYGIAGSALATAIIASANNLLRYLFLRLRYNMQPYDRNSLLLLGIAALSFLAVHFIPAAPHFLLDMFLRGTLVVVVFVVLIMRTEATPEINRKIRKNLLHLPGNRSAKN